MVTPRAIGNPPDSSGGSYWQKVWLLFAARQNKTFLSAAFTTLALIYHVTVHDLRKAHRNALVGLLLQATAMVVMILGFRLMFHILGAKGSPVRGDYIVYIMSGIFLYFTHIGSVSAVSGAGSATSPMMKHGPMNTAVLITGSALAALYRSTFSAFAVLGLYYLWKPFELENGLACFAMLMLAWGSGCTVGLIFLAVKPWSPAATNILTTVYTRANMIASGKMFLANTVPAHILVFFNWNPLFHIIDQTRGFAFINYTPHNSSLSYPIYVSIACLMIGLMAEFATRQVVSLSWSAAN